MFTSPQSPSSSTSSASNNDPLQFLAGVAIDSKSMNPSSRQSSPSCPHSPTRSSKRLSQRRYDCSDSPSSSTTASLDDCSANDSGISYTKTPHDARKACHKSPKPTPSFKRAKEAARPHRQEVINRASKIKTVENSPANPRQLRVLRMVYDEITNYPKEHWMALIAIVIHRSFNQVKHWFSNERQKNKGGEFINWKTDIGEKIRVRPLAVQLSSEWSDELFEAALMVFHFRLMRLIRWEEENDSSSHLSR
ncbi:hypothetical protein AAF712_000741 [Marasmius tenuissimus]|uniref:Homeobox domain-containing protein n=1 Tax=Marasmius tenuissimus TaxID=585030 RepID=A0ABR3AEG0_9AGAR|nr:hypothetical protein PM082_002589 [Marasmius tenuissimus]